MTEQQLTSALYENQVIRELRETIHYFKQLYHLAKSDGVRKALLFDAAMTALDFWFSPALDHYCRPDKNIKDFLVTSELTRDEVLGFQVVFDSLYGMGSKEDFTQTTIVNNLNNRR